MAMAGGHFGVVLRRIEQLFAAGSVAGLSEGQLIERFATVGDEAAFEAILARHGPMVLGICRQVLRDPNDVEDAFQATFLVLVRKAGTLRDRNLLGNWLFGVATRVALRARATASRRRTVEAPEADDLADATSMSVPGADPESRAMLHEEVRRLPEKYRAPVVLCYLEGLTHDEAARQLGWPIGTVKGRLARARDLLRRRLTRRGLTLSAAALSTTLSSGARASVPSALVESTIKAALAVASGRALLLGGAVAANVAALTKGVLNAMFWSKLNTAAAALVAAGVVTIGVGGWAYRASGGNGGPSGSPPAAAEVGPVALGTVADEPASAGGGRVEGKGEISRAIPEIRPGAGYVDENEFGGIVERAFIEILARAEMRTGRFDDLERIIRWSERELELQLGISQGEVERREALAAHADRMKRLHEFTQRIPMSDPDQPAKADLARVHRQMAERRLAEANRGRSADPGPAMPERPKESSIIAKTVPPRQENPRSPSETASIGAGGGGLGGNANFDGENYRETRIEIAKLAPRIAARDKTPGTRTILAKLDEPISMSFANETPLDDVLKYIKEKTKGPNDNGIPIYVDPIGLNEAEKALSSVVQLDLEGVPLKTSLRLLLSQLDLAYCVKEGVLFISSVDGIRQELKEAEAVAEAGVELPPAEPDEPAKATPTPAAAPGQLPNPGQPDAESKQLGTQPAVGAASAAPPGGFGGLGGRGQGGVPRAAMNAPRSQPDPEKLKRAQAIWKKLDEPITLSFAKPTPLGEMLDRIKGALHDRDGSGVPIYVDPRVREELKRSDQIDLEGVPLRTILTLLLARHDLNWNILDGVLIVSDQTGMQPIGGVLSTLRNSYVRDPSGTDFRNLINPDRVVTLSFPEPTPLKAVLEAIQKAAKGPDGGLTFYFGPPVSEGDDSGGRVIKIEEKRVQIDLKDAPIGLCLALVLSQANLNVAVLGRVIVIGEDQWTREVQNRGPRGFLGEGLGGGFR